MSYELKMQHEKFRVLNEDLRSLLKGVFVTSWLPSLLERDRG